MTGSALMAGVFALGRKGLKAARLSTTARWRSALRHGVAATIEHDRLPLRRDYQTVIDVGANRGQFSLYARERFPEAKIFSIEPLCGPRSRIEKLFGQDGQVEILGFAAGAAGGAASLNVTQHDDSSSLLAPTTLQTTRFRGTDVTASERVAVRALDEALGGRPLARPALLKIDVQGFELEVLKGAGVLLREIDAVLIECSFVEFYSGQAIFDDVYRMMGAHGFQLLGGVVSAATGSRWEQGDFVFGRAA